jgi:hypothetical protein
VSDATHAALVAHYGERGVVDEMGTISYYTLVSMSLNVDQYPIPDGVQPEQKPLSGTMPNLCPSDTSGTHWSSSM